MAIPSDGLERNVYFWFVDVAPVDDVDDALFSEVDQLCKFIDSKPVVEEDDFL